MSSYPWNNSVLTVLAVSMSIIKHSTALTLYVTAHICCPCHYDYVSAYVYYTYYGNLVMTTMHNHYGCLNIYMRA